MDFGWPGSSLGASGDDLNLLGGALLEVDDKTLQVSSMAGFLAHPVAVLGRYAAM